MLTVPILRALSRRSTPVTAAQLVRATGVGTEVGVRRAVERLATHGVCRREEIGGRVVYALNYDHVLHDAVAALLDAEQALPRRLTALLVQWDPVPLAVVLFGSAARRDGDVDSDIDLLLVRPPLPSDRARRDWTRQVHELRLAVGTWTGNSVQLLDWSQAVLRRHARSGEPLVADILADGVLLAGSRLAELLQDAP